MKVFLGLLTLVAGLLVHFLLYLQHAKEAGTPGGSGQ